MKRTISFVAAALASGLAAACASSLVKTESDYHTAYSHRNFATYHGGRDTRVDVVGDTMGLDTRAFGNAVTGAMQGYDFGQHTNFTTTPGSSAEPNMRVIMAFNTASDHYLCRAKDFPPRPATGKVILQGAWCFGDRTDSYVQAEVGTARPGDPTFSALVAQTTLDLFPQYMDSFLVENEDENDTFP